MKMSKVIRFERHSENMLSVLKDVLKHDRTKSESLQIMCNFGESLVDTNRDILSIFSPVIREMIGSVPNAQPVVISLPDFDKNTVASV